MTACQALVPGSRGLDKMRGGRSSRSVTDKQATSDHFYQLCRNLFNCHNLSRSLLIYLDFLQVIETYFNVHFSFFRSSALVIVLWVKRLSCRTWYSLDSDLFHLHAGTYITDKVVFMAV